MKNICMIIAIFFALISLSCSNDSGSTGPDDNIRFGDLTLNVQNMIDNVGQKMYLKVISDNNELQMLGVVNNLRAPNKTYSIPDCLDEFTDHLDFYLDYNDNNDYDPPPEDHAWRINIPSNGRVSFFHNTDFTDISEPQYDFPGRMATLKFMNFTDFVGDMMEIRIIEADSKRVVGFYRYDEIPNIVFTAFLPEIIREDIDYQIDFYVDRNQNRLYDPPPEDHAWRLTATGTSAGFSLTFSHNRDFVDIEF